MGRKRLYDSYEEAVERNREKSAERSREKNDSVKEIGPLPEVFDPARKESCENSLLKFMMTYGGTPEAEELYTFIHPFCEEQLFLIHALEDVLLHGGEVPLCIFRGGCKTTFCEWGILWAALYGHQRFALVVAANLGASRRIIANIKANLETNPILAEDFPEACYPIEKLGRANQRAKTQTLDGLNTEITMTADNIRLPKVKGKRSSQAIIYGTGADSSFRGLKVGKQRPTVVLIDDPQTNKSARSVKQTDDRWENITTSMKGLAGPGVDLAMVATITVIKKGDLAERILERWGGKRFSILHSMPKNMGAWEEYKEEMERLKLSVENVPERQKLLNDFYLQNREKLDEGTEAAWEYTATDSEISGIQHAMNLYCFDQKAFWSEYMNQPEEDEKDSENISVESLEGKIRKDLAKGIVPTESTIITSGVDIQKDCLYWLVAAWSPEFSGHVLEYGRYPKGNIKMATAYPGMAFEEQVENCLGELGKILLAKKFYREGSKEELEIGKVIADANWGLVNTQIKKVCKRMPKKFMEPTLGWGRGPNQRFNAQKKKLGEERGPEWRKPPLEIKGVCRTIMYNTNWWKSCVRSRIQAGIYARSTLTFYAGDSVTHQKLFRHLLGEISEKLTGLYGTIDQWRLTPGEPNHWWDCLTMAAVGASVAGVRLPESREEKEIVQFSSERKEKRWMEF